MKKHPMAGTTVKIEAGSFKGQYFKVIDYLQNQFQGKDMDKLAASRPQLVTPVVGRGYPLDDKIVYGRLYPGMHEMCVHDQELLLPKVQPPLREEEAADGVKEGLKLVEKENQDDTGKPSEGNSGTTGTGDERNGRSVSSEETSKGSDSGRVKTKKKD